jgi:hypothetical protein
VVARKPASGGFTGLDEFDRVVAFLGDQPEIGVPYISPGIERVRWLRLRKTPYKVYYHYKRGGGLVSIVSVWSGMRGYGPAFEQI